MLATELKLNRAMSWFFGIGATGFALGSLPFYYQNLPAGLVAATFFVASIFFTSGGYTQYYLSINTDDTSPRVLFRLGGLSRDGMASIIQLAGTLFFNISTFVPLLGDLSTTQTDRAVWSPDAFGSVAFLVSSIISVQIARSGSVTDIRVAVANLMGSVAFGISAIAAFVLPRTDEMISVEAVNLTTFIGAVLFLVGAIMAYPRDRKLVGTG